jgi:hypothetical protein
MIPFTEWFPLVVLGVTFTALGCLKMYGLARGIEGGSDRPVAQRMCGT